MIIDHRENFQLMFFYCAEMLTVVVTHSASEWTMGIYDDTGNCIYCLPFERHSSEKSLAKTMPRNDLPMSNLMLNNSRVQFILTASNLFSSIVDGGLLDQQPCKYKISI